VTHAKATHRKTPSARLDADGFCETDESRYFIRSIEDLAHKLRDELRGGTSSTSLGGGGSGSNGA
jgi:hypothetical protein